MTIIFDIFPSYGHQHSSYKLAEILKEFGHKIIYIGEYRYFKNLPSEFSRRYINPHIFNFIEIDTTSFRKNIKKAFSEKRKHKYHNFHQQTIKQYDELMEKIKPDVILVDHHYVQKAVLYHKYRVPVISVQTAPASEMDLLIPPFNSSHIPNQSLYSKLYVRYLWYSHIFRKRCRFFFYQFMYFGENHLSDVKRLAKQTGYPIKKQIDFKYYKGYGEFGLKKYPAIVTITSRLRFSASLERKSICYRTVIVGRERY